MRYILSFFLLFTFGVFGQQLPQYSQWSTHQFALNPAHAGIKQCIDFQSLYRMQWVGIEGAPRSGFFTASFPIKTRSKRLYSPRQGMGIKFENDRIGQFGMNRFNLAYAGHFNFTKDTRLSLGVYGGIVQYGLDVANTTTIDSDPAVTQDVSFIAPDAHFGVWWNGVDYYLGLTVNQLIPVRWDIGNQARQRFHVMVNGGLRKGINDKWTFLPSAMIKQPVIGPTVVDLNALMDFKDQFGFGAGYRNIDAIVVTAYLKISERFRIQYSYDVTTSALRNYSSGTHEISLGYINCTRPKTGKSSCPLFN